MEGYLTASQSILENLLETQEFQHGQVDCGMESKTAFVWTKGRVELHAISTVYLQLAFVVLPGDAELDHTFRDGCYLEGCLVLWVLLEKTRVLESGGKLYANCQ